MNVNRSVPLVDAHPPFFILFITFLQIAFGGSEDAITYQFTKHRNVAARIAPFKLKCAKHSCREADPSRGLRQGCFYIHSKVFEKTYHQRSIIELVFSSFECRFTAIVRAKKMVTQRLQLFLRCICYNLLS